MIIQPTDLYTHLYPEVVEQIIREDHSIAQDAIATASAEVASYLQRFDAEGMLAANSTATGLGLSHLKSLVKDIACWRLLTLSNPSIDLPLFRSRYEDAIKYLDKVMKSQATPVGWPLRANDPNTELDEAAGPIEWSSNRKRQNHF